ncbi:hypothetical protein RAH57_10480 [Chryseobacterium sp. CKR4-1]|uniref:hypothetical protein n=1 Tax=Chryseobacterium sp. CKR4-1 TaxID=3068896 RepID=UPI0027966E1D|nr:hypothetical protein [Chryseobacterium sp. CKR4-1]MDQ1804417.1 hypothetical protein [Chryseobacterium sp. CKR4-1]
MKKLILTSLLGLGLLLPANFSAATNSATSSPEFFSKKPKKSKSRKGKSGKRSTKTYTKNRGCTYNGYPLNVGPRGGCYYYSGSSKVYVERAYCSGCN